MFEDIIQDNKKLLKKQITDHGQCPSCGGTDMKNLDGIFVPNGYVETAYCNQCGIKWVITYDVDLNIVNIQHGS